MCVMTEHAINKCPIGHFFIKKIPINRYNKLPLSSAEI